MMKICNFAVKNNRMPLHDPTELFIYAPDADFLLPYFRREFTVAGQEAPFALMVSSTAIYRSTYGTIDENSDIDSSSIWSAREQEFLTRTDITASRRYILRCAPIIGTGMTGDMRHLAEEIYRGIFFHFPGNEARKSVVHASDVARAAKFLIDNDIAAGVYNLTDGADPTLHDIAEALAYRMENKRISNISTRPQQWIARLIYGKSRYTRYTSDQIYSSALIRGLGFEPTDTCQYLHTHIYDQESL